MLWFQATVRSVAEQPNTLPGQLAICPDCHGEDWYLFRLADQAAVYVQCCGCERVELLTGQADSRLAVYSLESPPLTGTAYARELIARGWQP